MYAVLAAASEAALARIRGAATDDARAEIVGGLSRDLVRRLGLTPGEARRV